MPITDYVGMIYLANNLNKIKSQPQVFMLFQIGNYNQTIVNVKLMFHMCYVGTNQVVDRDMFGDR